MKKQNLRVIVASEHLQTRDFLKEMAEEDGAIIVGQAQDANRALALVRNLRPDAAIIDCYLPHAVGMDDIPLSRIGGLDTAQIISEEIPTTKVLLLNNLDVMSLPEYRLTREGVPFFSRDKLADSTPFTLQELLHEVRTPESLVFARVGMKPWTPTRQKASGITEKAMLFGGVTLFAGWFLTLTVFLAPIGIPLVVIGGLAMLAGFARKWLTRPNKDARNGKDAT